jgi:vacuolar-type H+-ATPase subunit E/Vma4
MQGNAIIERIKTDAQKSADEIRRVADQQALLSLQQAETVLDEDTKKNDEIIKQKEQEIEQNFDIQTRLEQKKLELDRKQKVLQDLKSQTVTQIEQLSKADTLKMLENLLSKNAEKGDVVYVSMPSVTINDVAKLKTVKALSLKVQKGKQTGLYLKGKIADTDLLLTTLVEQSFNKHQLEIVSILFD